MVEAHTFIEQVRIFVGSECMDAVALDYHERAREAVVKSVRRSEGDPRHRHMRCVAEGVVRTSCTGSPAIICEYKDHLTPKALPADSSSNIVTVILTTAIMAALRQLLV